MRSSTITSRIVPKSLTLFGAMVMLSPGTPAIAQEGAAHAAETSPVQAVAEAMDSAHSGPSLLLVDSRTRVASVEFRFVSGEALDEESLRELLAFRGPGSLSDLREAFDFVPGISGPELELFSPLALQKDLARLRRRYHAAGFPDAAVDYDVALDTAANEVDVDWVVAQGPPVVVVSVSLELAGDGGLAPQLTEPWAAYEGEIQRARGRRYGMQERARLENGTADWLREHGYPWARARVASADTVDGRVHARLKVAPGPRARVGEIGFEGRRRLAEATLRREVPLEPGDWFDAGAIAEGEAQIYELDIVRRALADVPSDQPRDTTVRVRYRVEETRPRLIWGRAGWRSEAGVAGEVHWSHRDVFGGARTLTVSTTAETGWGALEQVRGRSGGISATIRQPYVGHRNVSATFGPFLRLRDDFRDRSILYGLESALIWRARPLETVTLQHELSRSRVDEGFQLVPIAELVSSGERPYDPVFVQSIFKLSASYGTLDDRLDPSSGYLLEPNVEVTAPSGLSDVDFVRFGASAVAVVPIAEALGLRLRASGGRLFPFGESVPDSTSAGTRAVVGLRGVMFTAGGTSDVRGWGSGSLGPKIPDVEVGSAGAVGADRYLPVGGLARVTGSVELMLPFPLLPPGHRTFVFADAGRIWTPGNDLAPGDPELAVEPWGVGVGGGVQLATPVGPVRLAVGHKLNPSRIDLLAADEVAAALAGGEDLSGLDEESLRRWHLHLSIGQGF